MYYTKERVEFIVSILNILKMQLLASTSFDLAELIKRHFGLEAKVFAIVNSYKSIMFSYLFLHCWQFKACGHLFFLVIDVALLFSEARLYDFVLFSKSLFLVVIISFIKFICLI